MRPTCACDCRAWSKFGARQTYSTAFILVLYIYIYIVLCEGGVMFSGDRGCGGHIWRLNIYEYLGWGGRCLCLYISGYYRKLKDAQNTYMHD